MAQFYSLTNLTTGIPGMDAVRQRIVANSGNSRMAVARDYIGRKLRELLPAHQFISYEAPQGDFQYLSLVGSILQGIGWGGHKAFCITFERRQPDGYLIQGYFASADLQLVQEQAVLREAEGWKILRRSWVICHK
jgi:hypothetical protein